MPRCAIAARGDQCASALYTASNESESEEFSGINEIEIRGNDTKR